MHNKDFLILPGFLKPMASYSLIRLGKFNDGGYQVDSRDVINSKILVSFGINFDWSFELDFKDNNKNISIYGYDGSVNSRFFIKQFLLSLYNPFKLGKSLYKIANFLFFFKIKHSFVSKFISYNSHNTYSLIDVLREIKAREKIFLKIDIEGWEYYLLDDILKNEKIFTGLVIEFHNFNLHIDRIKKFVNKFRLNIAHVHVNNYSFIKNKHYPECIEVTFTSQKKIIDSPPNLPNEYDSPCDPLNSDRKVKFTN